MANEEKLASGLKLLHLEDNVTDAELIGLQLSEVWPECTIRRVETREEFRNALQSERYDVILSDFSLPGFNGLEALTLAREHDPALPFLFLSGTIGEDNAVEALQRGAVDYVIKDRPARLVSAIKRALEQYREHNLRREAEQRLREQAEVLDKARDAICVTDPSGLVTYWNRSAGQLFGFDRGDAAEHRIEGMFGPAGRTFLPEAFREVHASGAWMMEVQLNAPRAGGLRHIVSRWTLVRDAENRPKSILLINSDVTEEKKLETQLLRSQRMDGIGTLAGGIAHDLNNVLAPILMSVNLLQLKLIDEELLQLVGVLEKSALHGAALVRQVLAFARGADGERADIQPQTVIHDVVTLLGQTLPRAVEIELDTSRDLWMVNANATQLSQVLMNLGVNARDAMGGSGRIRIRASNVTVDEALASANPGSRAGPHVLITVSDNGSGISPELINRIFDPFFTTKVAGKGTGLGLSTVLGIMKGHGGFVQVQSEVGVGTEFRLFFPAAVSNASRAPGNVSAPPPKGNGETVLLIDDEDGVRAVVKALLEVHNYRVLESNCGSRGLDLFRAHRSQVKAVLTDMMMPGLQGSDVIRELRQLDPDIRIVAMSGVIDERARFKEAPDHIAFLAKPMSGDDLLRAVHHVLH